MWKSYSRIVRLPSNSKAAFPLPNPNPMGSYRPGLVGSGSVGVIISERGYKMYEYHILYDVRGND